MAQKQENTATPGGKAYSYVRWSHSSQKEGDSLRRQLEATLEYCKENNLSLDDSLELTDAGRSGFFKSNIHKGRLGKFLKMVREGTIPKGSALIIENLDRLTRAQVGDALEILRSILRYGVDVVTLTDKHRYTKASLNDPMELMLSIMTFYRSHDESVQKARRVRKAWEAKRTCLDKKKITARGPYWLSYDKETGTFIERPEAVKRIKRIFKLSFNGMGHGSIARTLNAEGVKNFAKKTDWQPSYIAKILQNRAVIGEYQPFTWRSQENEETGEIRRWREPIGAPVKNYYPTIIDEDLFSAVQARKRNRRCSVGRLYPDRNSGAPAVLGNLFTNVAKCGFCGAPMVFVDKGRGWVSLVCDKARRGLGCRYAGYPYSEFESSFLRYCSELNVENVFVNDSVDTIVSEIDATEGEIAQLRNQIQRLVAGMRDAKREPAAVIREIDNLEAQLAAKEEKWRALREEKANAQSDSKRLESLQAVIAALKSAPAAKRNEIRHALRERVRSCVSVIKVYPYEIIAPQAEGMTPSERREARQAGYSLTSEVQRVNRGYWVYFKDEQRAREVNSHPKYSGRISDGYLLPKGWRGSGSGIEPK